MYSLRVGILGCLSCPLGMSGMQPGAVTLEYGCASCSAGEFGNYRTAARAELEKYNYQIERRGVECDTCPVGKFQSGRKQTSCHECQVGYIGNATVDRDVCTRCSNGQFAHNRHQCRTCAPGRFSAAPESACADCAKGSYQPQAGSTSCAMCQRGKEASGLGSYACRYCPAGSHWQPGKACASCTKGRFQQHAGAVSCKLCAVGMFGNRTAGTSCAACRPGRYQKWPGAPLCWKCPVGQIRPAGRPAASCVACVEQGVFEDWNKDRIADATRTKCVSEEQSIVSRARVKVTVMENVTTSTHAPESMQDMFATLMNQTNAPTPAPTAPPTQSPTETPSHAPTAVPSPVPTLQPTASPSPMPTLSPTPKPTMRWSQYARLPSGRSRAPTPAPTVNATALPQAHRSSAGQQGRQEPSGEAAEVEEAAHSHRGLLGLCGMAAAVAVWVPWKNSWEHTAPSAVSEEEVTLRRLPRPPPVVSYQRSMQAELGEFPVGYTHLPI